MPAMKLTPNAAMRARDVSRPRAEHLAEAEAAEAPGSAGRADTGRMDTGRAESPRTRTDDGEQGGTITGGAEDDRVAPPGFPRRRRGTRDGGRHGRSSR